MNQKFQFIINRMPAIPAMEVIEVDEQYRKLAEHLLGNVFIAENEDALTE